VQGGILPISEKYHFAIYRGWDLPGHGTSYADCGSLRFRGCLNVDNHYGDLEDPERSSKAYVQGYYRSCARKECPKCYESWAGLEANRASYRLLSYVVKPSTVKKIFSISEDALRSKYVDRAFRFARRKVIHVIFSIPSHHCGEGIEVLRFYLYKLAKKTGLSGGLAIFHPFRERPDRSWYFSPHFHVLAFGWIRHTKILFEKYGWVIKNAGVRKSVHATLMYQLSHAGVHKEHHVVTWFGDLSYNKLKEVDPIPEILPCCPICGARLLELIFCGGLDRPPPDEEGSFWLNAGDWRIKTRTSYE